MLTAVRICRAEWWDARRISPRWRIRLDESLAKNPDYAHSKLQGFQEMVQDPGRRPGWSKYIDTNHIRRRLRALRDANHVNTTTGNEIADATSRKVGDIFKVHSSVYSIKNCAALVFITTSEVSNSFEALRDYEPFRGTPKTNEIYEFIWDPDSYGTSHPKRKPMYLGAYENDI